MADVTRVIDGPTPIADLPALGGIAREQVASALALLTTSGLATATTGRGRTVTLTPRGVAEQTVHATLLAEVSRALPDLSGEVARPEVVRALTPRDGWRSRPPYLAQTRRFLEDPTRWLPQHPIVTSGWLPRRELAVVARDVVQAAMRVMGAWRSREPCGRWVL